MKEFGEYLRNERLARGVTLEEIERRTRIRRQHLTAIEAGEFHRLPEAAYVKAFLRHYARCVGLDPSAVVERYEQLQGPAAAGEAATASAGERSERRLRQRKARRRRRIWQWVILLLIVAGLIGIYFGEDLAAWARNLPFFSRQDPAAVESHDLEETSTTDGTTDLLDRAVEQPPVEGQDGAAEITAEPLEEQPSPDLAAQLSVPHEQPDDRVVTSAAPDVPEPEDAPPSTAARPVDLSTDPIVVPALSDAGFTLELVATGVSWTELQVDGSRVVYRNLEPGEHVSYVVRREASLRLGRAGDVDIYLNGQLAGTIGEGVVSRRFIIDERSE